MKFRIKQIRSQRGLSQVQVAEETGISQPFLSLLERGKDERAASIETLEKIAIALNVRVADLFDDTKPTPIVGRVGAGALVPLVQPYGVNDGLYHVACPSELVGVANVVGVEIEGESMLPVYKSGDILFYVRAIFGVPTEAVGSICVCEDESENAWVKFVKTGTQPGKFHLISLNPMAENMFDVTLKWAAPVRLHWPKDLVELA